MYQAKSAENQVEGGAGERRWGKKIHILLLEILKSHKFLKLEKFSKWPQSTVLIDTQTSLSRFTLKTRCD